MDVPARINLFRRDEELSRKAGKGKVSVDSSLVSLSHLGTQLRCFYGLCSGDSCWLQPRGDSAAGKCQVWRRSGGVKKSQGGRD